MVAPGQTKVIGKWEGGTFHPAPGVSESTAAKVSTGSSSGTPYKPGTVITPSTPSSSSSTPSPTNVQYTTIGGQRYAIQGNTMTRIGTNYLPFDSPGRVATPYIPPTTPRAQMTERGWKMWMDSVDSQQTREKIKAAYEEWKGGKESKYTPKIGEFKDGIYTGTIEGSGQPLSPVIKNIVAKIDNKQPITQEENRLVREYITARGGAITPLGSSTDINPITETLVLTGKQEKPAAAETYLKRTQEVSATLVEPKVSYQVKEFDISTPTSKTIQTMGISGTNLKDLVSGSGTIANIGVESLAEKVKEYGPTITKYLTKIPTEWTTRGRNLLEEMNIFKAMERQKEIQSIPSATGRIGRSLEVSGDIAYKTLDYLVGAPYEAALDITKVVGTTVRIPVETAIRGGEKTAQTQAGKEFSKTTFESLAELATRHPTTAKAVQVGTGVSAEVATMLGSPREYTTIKPVYETVIKDGKEATKLVGYLTPEQRMQRIATDLDLKQSYLSELQAIPAGQEMTDIQGKPINVKLLIAETQTAINEDKAMMASIATEIKNIPAERQAFVEEESGRLGLTTLLAGTAIASGMPVAQTAIRFGRGALTSLGSTVITRGVPYGEGQRTPGIQDIPIIGKPAATAIEIGAGYVGFMGPQLKTGIPAPEPKSMTVSVKQPKIIGEGKEGALKVASKDVIYKTSEGGFVKVQKGELLPQNIKQEVGISDLLGTTTTKTGVLQKIKNIISKPKTSTYEPIEEMITVEATPKTVSYDFTTNYGEVNLNKIGMTAEMPSTGYIPQQFGDIIKPTSIRGITERAFVPKYTLGEARYTYTQAPKATDIEFFGGSEVRVLERPSLIDRIMGRYNRPLTEGRSADILSTISQETPGKIKPSSQYTKIAAEQTKLSKDMENTFKDTFDIEVSKEVQKTRIVKGGELTTDVQEVGRYDTTSLNREILSTRAVGEEVGGVKELGYGLKATKLTTGRGISLTQIQAELDKTNILKIGEGKTISKSNYWNIIGDIGRKPGIGKELLGTKTVVKAEELSRTVSEIGGTQTGIEANREYIIMRNALTTPRIISKPTTPTTHIGESLSSFMGDITLKPTKFVPSKLPSTTTIKSTGFMDMGTGKNQLEMLVKSETVKPSTLLKQATAENFLEKASLAAGKIQPLTTITRHVGMPIIMKPIPTKQATILKTRSATAIIPRVIPKTRNDIESLIKTESITKQTPETILRTEPVSVVRQATITRQTPTQIERLLTGTSQTTITRTTEIIREPAITTNIFPRTVSPLPRWFGGSGPSGIGGRAEEPLFGLSARRIKNPLPTPEELIGAPTPSEKNKKKKKPSIEDLFR